MPLDDDGPVARSSADMTRLGHRISEARRRLGDHGADAVDDRDELEARRDGPAEHLDSE